MRMDLKHYLSRPSEHLQKYPVLLEAISRETVRRNPDIDFLSEAILAIKNLQTFAQLRTFQTAMNKGTPGKWDWNDLVPKEVLRTIPANEVQRQRYALRELFVGVGAKTCLALSLKSSKAKCRM
jgi:RHO1 GDP-GTP exchange protein 1/2